MNALAQLCREVAKAPATSQRQIAERLGFSLGQTHGLIKEATKSNYITQTNGTYELTDQGRAWLQQFKVDNAVILAAGFGSRFVPFTYDTPKGLMKVQGTPMIERQIEQLLEVGVTEIVIVVGYLKEKFEYLTDKYGAKLIFNPEYAAKNNLSSLYCAREYLGNTYILVADHWMENSIFNAYEPDSWLSCVHIDEPSNEWEAVLGPHGRVRKIEIGMTSGWALIGPAFFSRSFSAAYRPLLEEYYGRPGTQDYYWENVVKENLKTLKIYANRQGSDNVHEFETFEELRQYDTSYLINTNNEALATIARVFDVPISQISGIRPLKEGLTNLSFVFECKGNQYVYRLPGVGSDTLINRRDEQATYRLIAPLGIADEIYYFDGETGVKISQYYANSRISNAEDDADVQIDMAVLRGIHAAGIKPEHRFDIEERVAFYERIAQDVDGITFADYDRVKVKVNELLAFRRLLNIPEGLCHVDFIYANVLHLDDGSIRVIDWEYSGAADTLLDVAMYSIFAYYTKEQIDRAIRHYLTREPTRREEARVYLYVALGGFLWSLWTEYKQALGDEFGDYSITMYRYFKEYYRVLKKGGYLSDGADSH